MPKLKTKDVFQDLDRMIKDKDINSLCRVLFNKKRIYPSQRRIIKAIAFDRDPRIAITAYTRYGKTFSVGLSLAFLVLFVRGPLRIAVIAPSEKQAKEVRREFTDAVLACPALRNSLDVNRERSAGNLKREASKKRLTFDDGEKELEIFTARAQSSTSGALQGTGAGSGLMSKGADVVVIDESCQIDEEVYTKYISRMLETETAQLIELSNPWHKHNHFFKHWTSDRFKTIHVSWKTGVEEGRHTEEFFEEKREESTELAWTVLYESQFPDVVEQGLIRYSWVEAAAKRALDTTGRKDVVKVAGFDVAGSGKDHAVLFKLHYVKGDYAAVELHSRPYSPDAMELTGWAAKKLGKDWIVCVDAVGMGWGVVSRLEERGYNVRAVNVGETPSREREKFLNKKAQYYWKLRTMFEEGRIYLKDHCPGELVQQLTGMRYEFTSAEKLKAIDPESGSPDYADSLMLAMAHSAGITIVGAGGKR